MAQGLSVHNYKEIQEIELEQKRTGKYYSIQFIHAYLKASHISVYELVWNLLPLHLEQAARIRYAAWVNICFQEADSDKINRLSREKFEQFVRRKQVVDYADLSVTIIDECYNKAILGHNGFSMGFRAFQEALEELVQLGYIESCK
jgi:sulfatase maturation enzyme AslB (radical SAM superfamily)